MIEHRIGDLLAQTDLDYLVHGANCQNTMGSGIAKLIRNKWPEVYESDLETRAGDAHKLGTYSRAKIRLDNGKECTVINLYQQYLYGRDRRYLNYEAFYNGMYGLKTEIGESKEILVGIPHKIGCNQAGGNWSIVLTMLIELFSASPIRLVICQLNEKTDKTGKN